MGNDSDETGFFLLPLAPIFVSAQCNQRCVCCPGRPTATVSERQIRQKLYQHDQICLLGGEPTLNRSLLGLIRRAKVYGSRRVALSTNGLRLSFRHYAKACLDAGLDEILFAFPSHQRAVCDALTGVGGSYELKNQALRRVRRSGTFPNLGRSAGHETLAHCDLWRMPIQRPMWWHAGALPASPRLKR